MIDEPVKEMIAKDQPPCMSKLVLTRPSTLPREAIWRRKGSFGSGGRWKCSLLGVPGWGPSLVCSPQEHEGRSEGYIQE